MGTYALISSSTGVVDNIIIWDGTEESGYSVPEGFFAVEYTQEIPAGPGYAYADGIFTPPPSPPVPALTAAEILQRNTSQRDSLLAIATAAVAPLQDAVDLDDATTSDVALLKKWKQYRVAVNRIDLTLKEPSWPDQPK